MTETNVEDLRLQNIADRSLTFNRNGGVYSNGRPLPEERYLLIVEKYLDLLIESDTGRVTIDQVARASNVGWHTANKTINRFISGRDVLGTSSQIIRPIGPGSKLGLTYEHETYILSLLFENPFRRNQDYVDRLFERYGLRVSSSFVTRWFQRRFKRKGRMTAPELVPLDKLKLSNIVKYKEFCSYVMHVASYRLVFVDEKSLKGAELFNEKGRPDPITGEQVSRLVGGDFRNTYCLMGMITINVEKGRPMVYSIGT